MYFPGFIDAVLEKQAERERAVQRLNVRNAYSAASFWEGWVEDVLANNPSPSRNNMLIGIRASAAAGVAQMRKDRDVYGNQWSLRDQRMFNLRLLAWTQFFYACYSDLYRFASCHRDVIDTLRGKLDAAKREGLSENAVWANLTEKEKQVLDELIHLMSDVEKLYSMDSNEARAYVQKRVEEYMQTIRFRRDSATIDWSSVPPMSWTEKNWPRFAHISNHPLLQASNTGFDLDQKPLDDLRDQILRGR